MLKNNKGFVLMETVIVITILSLGLIALYASYALMLSRTTLKSNYDNVEFIYKAYWVKEYMVRHSMHQPAANTISHHCLRIRTLTPANFPADSDAWCTEFAAAAGTREAGLRSLMTHLQIERIYVVNREMNHPGGYTAFFERVRNPFDGTTIEYAKHLRSHWGESGRNAPAASRRFVLIVKFSELHPTLCLNQAGCRFRNVNFASIEYN